MDKSHLCWPILASVKNKQNQKKHPTVQLQSFCHLQMSWKGHNIKITTGQDLPTIKMLLARAWLQAEQHTLLHSRSMHTSRNGNKQKRAEITLSCIRTENLPVSVGGQPYHSWYTHSYMHILGKHVPGVNSSKAFLVPALSVTSELFLLPCLLKEDMIMVKIFQGIYSTFTIYSLFFNSHFLCLLLERS